MNEFLNNLTNKEWFITVVAFLTTNLGAIMTMAILLIKERIKANRLAQSVNEILANAGIQLNQDNIEKLEAINSNLDEKLDKMLDMVYSKLKIDTLEKQEQLAAKTEEFNKLLEASINLDEVDTSEVKE